MQRHQTSKKAVARFTELLLIQHIPSLTSIKLTAAYPLGSSRRGVMKAARSRPKDPCCSETAGSVAGRGPPSIKVFLPSWSCRKCFLDRHRYSTVIQTSVANPVQYSTGTHFRLVLQIPYSKAISD